MRLTRPLLAACALLVVVASPAGATKPIDGNEFFQANAFYGRGKYVAVPTPRSAKVGERVVVFAERKAPAWSTITNVMATKEAKNAFDKLGFEHIYGQPALWAKYGGYWSFQGPDAPSSLAQLSHALEESEPFLAVRRLPSSSEFVGGTASIATAAERQSLLKLIPAGERAGKTLVQGLLYGKTGRTPLAELFVGYPAFAPNSASKIKTIRFKRYSFVNNQLLSVQEFRRETGVEERVETEAPILTTSNWYDITAKTVGFVRIDGSQKWFRLTIDSGFEGINFQIAAVDSSSNPAYSASHYTPH